MTAPSKDTETPPKTYRATPSLGFLLSANNPSGSEIDIKNMTRKEQTMLSQASFFAQMLRPSPQDATQEEETIEAGEQDDPPVNEVQINTTETHDTDGDDKEYSKDASGVSVSDSRTETTDGSESKRTSPALKMKTSNSATKKTPPKSVAPKARPKRTKKKALARGKHIKKKKLPLRKNVIRVTRSRQQANKEAHNDDNADTNDAESSDDNDADYQDVADEDSADYGVGDMQADDATYEGSVALTVHSTIQLRPTQQRHSLRN